VANFINNQDLLEVVCKRIALIIVDNDIETLRNMLGISEPMSAQEEQSIFVQNELCIMSRDAK